MTTNNGVFDTTSSIECQKGVGNREKGIRHVKRVLFFIKVEKCRKMKLEIGLTSESDVSPIFF